MQISVSEAKARLTDLIRRAEAGEDVVLTRHGKAVATISPVKSPVDMARRRTAIEALIGSAKNLDGVSAERSHDFLYDDDGLPG